MSRSADPKTDDETLRLARDVLDKEARAIGALRDGLGAEFASAVSLILDLKGHGRLVLSGMGKAGIIAQKVSATFASIGISSFYLHPAEAIHGDLGRFSRNDLALILSNSGETPEIVRILDPIKRIGCPIIALTARVSSTLGEHSDVVLELGELSEAQPLGIAPTTTTTAMLAMGDALAMCVLHRLGLSRDQYAAFHPGGAIGRALMHVSDVMRVGDEHCVVPQGLAAREVLHRISAAKGRPGAASIVDDDGTLVGIFTDGNLRRCLEDGADFLSQPIGAVMTREPKVVTADQLATEALRVLSDFKIDQVIVVDSARRPIGLVDIQDLVDFRSDR